MYECDVIVPGYTHDPEGYAATLKRILGERGDVEVIVVDVFKKERENWLFKKTLLTTSNHVSAVEEMEARVKYLMDLQIRFHDVKIRKLYTHSYGVVSILAPSLDAEEYVLIAPPLESVQWKSIEKLFWFLPGFKELRNGSLQEKFLQKIAALNSSGKKVTIIISSLNEGEGGYGDERVGYSEALVDKLVRLAHVRILHAKHGQFMRDPAIVDTLL